MLTTKEFAEEVHAAYPTVMGWLRRGMIPGAVFDDTIPRGGIWRIPADAVSQFRKEGRHRGRPRTPRPKGR
ncbi:MAG TPA: hypothetical protein VJX67_19275 [Blastocatellia bacterium]|nr:hypothetical protein [Blastocatellia bacterium]